MLQRFTTPNNNSHFRVLPTNVLTIFKQNIEHTHNKMIINMNITNWITGTLDHCTTLVSLKSIWKHITILIMIKTLRTELAIQYPIITLIAILTCSLWESDSYAVFCVVPDGTRSGRNVPDEWTENLANCKVIIITTLLIIFLIYSYFHSPSMSKWQ